MFLTEPSPSQADLHFRLLGVPVRIHPTFWIGSALLHLAGSRHSGLLETAIWVGVVLVSVLVHEFGHAMMQRYFGGHPWVTLYGFGGLASCGDCDRRHKSQILISAAGPFAGFCLAALVAAFIYSQRSFVEVEWGAIPNIFWMPPFESWSLQVAIRFLLFVNIAWGLLNLLPVYPLDGGRIVRELCQMWNSQTGTLRSLQISTIVGGLVAAYAFHNQQYYMCLMFGCLAYGSYQAAQSNQYPWR